MKMARGRKSGIVINWDRVESLVVKKTYEKDSASDAKYPHKAGDVYERVGVDSLGTANEVFSGNAGAILKVLSDFLTARREARKADPDAAFNVPAKRLIAADFFGSDLVVADKENPTSAEIKSAIALLKALKK